LLAIYLSEGAAESRAGQIGGSEAAFTSPEHGKVVCHLLSDQKCFAESGKC